MRISNAILRGVSGAYLLQSGYGKLGMDAQAAEGLKQVAATGVPQFAEWDSKTFATFIAGSELAVGAALVTPFVQPNPSCVGYSPPPPGRACSTSYFSSIRPVSR